MLDFLKNVFNSSMAQNNSAVGIDIGSSAIKVVQLRKEKGKAILETYGELALGPYNGLEVGQATVLPNQKIAEAVVDILREAHVTTVNAGISIPFSASLMSLIEVPKISDSQLAQTVPIEARKYIPVPIAEVNLDWWQIPEIPKSYIDEVTLAEKKDKPETAGPHKVEVLIAAIHKDTVTKYQQIVAAAKLNATFFEIELFSTLRSVLRRELAVTMVVDVGASSTKVFIVERGVLRSSHTINKGSQDITLGIARSLTIPVKQAEEMKRTLMQSGKINDADVMSVVELTTTYILSEISRIALNFERKYNTVIHKVILAGGGVLLDDFMVQAKKELQMEVALANPFQAVEAPAFLEPVLRTAGPEFAVAIGLALRKLEER